MLSSGHAAAGTGMHCFFNASKELQSKKSTFDKKKNFASFRSGRPEKTPSERPKSVS